MNNRKKTKGRTIHQQDIGESTGKDGNTIYKRTIKHIQPTINRIRVMNILFENAKRIMRKYRDEKSKKPSGRVIWDSKNDGTYIKSIHGKIGS